MGRGEHAIGCGLPSSPSNGSAHPIAARLPHASSEMVVLARPRQMMLKIGSILFTIFFASARLLFGALANPGFEEAVPTAGWEINIYGAKPSFQSDTTIRHGGHTALRIESAEPSDTALAQEITVAPARWHRFSAWVRTDQLDPRGAPVSGTVQVQRPKGAGLIASAASQRGTTDWTH